MKKSSDLITLKRSTQKRRKEGGEKNIRENYNALLKL